MSRSTNHARIPYFPYAESLRYARLDALNEEPQGKGTSLTLDYQELVLHAPPKLVEHDGAPAEQLQGYYVPRRLHFTGITSLKRTGLYAIPDALPVDHPARNLQGMLHWYPPGKNEPLYLLINGSTEPADLMLSAKCCTQEARFGSEVQVILIGHWSSPPPLPARLIPNRILSRYGGDPITICVGDRLYHRRLFVGGIEQQSETRPDVDVVLNIGEEPSRFASVGSTPQDRWSVKGEGSQGMTLDELAEEARWVIEWLRAGKRVLVHCSAGFNRSVTLCCATLIQLERLTAEEALQRVQEHHPWARPDAHHWLTLRWLAHRSTSQ